MAWPKRHSRRTADADRNHIRLNPELGVRATSSSAKAHAPPLASRQHPGSDFVLAAVSPFCQRSHRGSRTSWRSNVDGVIESAPIRARNTSALGYCRPSPWFLLRPASPATSAQRPRSSTPPRDSQQGDERAESANSVAPSALPASLVGWPSTTRITSGQPFGPYIEGRVPAATPNPACSGLAALAADASVRRRRNITS